jgi:hypothetical protein
MNSDQQYHRDAELFAAGVCPVCLKQVGKTRPRHAIVQHFHMQKKVDLEHALYATTTYKQHFRHGRLKKTLLVKAPEIVAMMHRHVEIDILDTILRPQCQENERAHANVRLDCKAQTISASPVLSQPV